MNRVLIRNITVGAVGVVLVSVVISGIYLKSSQNNLSSQLNSGNKQDASYQDGVTPSELDYSIPEDKVTVGNSEYQIITELAKGDMVVLDQSIVKTDLVTKEKETVVSSIKSVIPEIGNGTTNLLVTDFVPQDSNYIVYSMVRYFTDNPMAVKYSFNIETNQIVKMKINDVAGFGGDFGGASSSSSNRQIIWIPDSEKEGLDQEMYLLDVINDTGKLIATLSGTETLNSGFGAMSNSYSVKWIDEKTISFQIYDQAKKDQIKEELSEDDRAKFLLIEERKITL